MKYTDQEKLQILFGCLLGDANLQTYTGGKSWRARFIQGDKHQDYLFHLYDIFQHWVKTPPQSITDKQGYTRWYFNTTVQPALIPMAKQFYSKKKKVLPELSVLETYLTPLALAYWFMDDGSLKSNARAYYLCTDNFTLSELKLMHAYLKTTYGWELAYHKKGLHSYRLYIPARFFHSFRQCIQPYIHASMYYKLSRTI